MSDTNKFISALQLEDPVTRLEARAPRATVFAAASMRAAVAADTDKPQGYVDLGSTVSFVSGVSSDNQDDVLNSTLLAQLAANKKFDREKDTPNWYKFYADVLGNVGWVIQQFSFQKYQASGASFEVDKVVLQILGSIASGNDIAVVQQTLDALKALSGKNDQRFVIFDTSSQSQSAGNFQISLATESGGKVVMSLGAFHFATSQTTTRFLWSSFSTSNSQIYQGGQTVTLNSSAYGKVRQQVIDRLGDNAKKFIANLDI
jgi:hypothetical protein